MKNGWVGFLEIIYDSTRRLKTLKTRLSGYAEFNHIDSVYDNEFTLLLQ